MARTRNGRGGGRGGRGARDDTPHPQVQDVEQEEVQVNQEEVPIMQGANVAQAPPPSGCSSSSTKRSEKPGSSNFKL